MTEFSSVPDWIMSSPHTPSEECQDIEDTDKWCEWCKVQLLNVYPMLKEKYI